jgi:hypothetical protein
MKEKHARNSKNNYILKRNLLEKSLTQWLPEKYQETFVDTKGLIKQILSNSKIGKRIFLQESVASIFSILVYSMSSYALLIN